MKNINIKVIPDEVFGKSLLLSVLISNCNFCNSTVCEDSAINIYHSPSVICHI